MNWKKPAFWSAFGTAAAVLGVGFMTSDQIDLADKYTGIVGIAAGCVLAAAGAFRAGLRSGRGLTPPPDGGN